MKLQRTYLAFGELSSSTISTYCGFRDLLNGRFSDSSDHYVPLSRLAIDLSSCSELRVHSGLGTSWQMNHCLKYVIMYRSITLF